MHGWKWGRLLPWLKMGTFVAMVILIQDVLSMTTCPWHVKPFYLLPCCIILLSLFLLYDYWAKSCISLLDVNGLKMYYRGSNSHQTSPDQILQSLLPTSFSMQLTFTLLTFNNFLRDFPRLHFLKLLWLEAWPYTGIVPGPDTIVSLKGKSTRTWKLPPPFIDSKNKFGRPLGRRIKHLLQRCGNFSLADAF